MLMCKRFADASRYSTFYMSLSPSSRRVHSSVEIEHLADHSRDILGCDSGSSQHQRCDRVDRPVRNASCMVMVSSGRLICGIIHRLTSVMIARFMLNLQEAHNRTLRLGSHADTQNSSFWRNSSVIFDRVMGSLGSSVIDDTRALGGEDDPNRATQP